MQTVQNLGGSDDRASAFERMDTSSQTVLRSFGLALYGNTR
jgi:hypothetical protein